MRSENSIVSANTTPNAARRRTGIAPAKAILGLTLSAVLGALLVVHIGRTERSMEQMYVVEHDAHLGMLPANAARQASDRISGAVAMGASKGNPAHGKELFNMSCFVCHGPTGAGVPGLGANLRASKFVATKNDNQLVDFIKVGRNPGDPNTVLNLTMPPKGGNPALDDAGILDVIAFIRTLQADEKGNGASAATAAPAVLAGSSAR
jgi:mono/diheme cytochrome c family protein